MKNKYNNVLWIFSHPIPNEIPSYVVSGIMPANILGIKKLIFLENHIPDKTLSIFKPNIIILSKSFHDNILNLINIAKEQNIKIISVFDDWNFDSNSKTDNTKRNLPIAKNSDLIVVKTQTASKVLHQNTKLTSFVIPDMLRFKGYEIISKINYPFEVIWFGMNSNHDTLINELKKIDKKNLKINLKIITNLINDIKIKIENIILENITIQYLDWHPNFNKEIIKSDVVILPYPNDKERLVKSANRIIDSLNLGRFVILSDVEQFTEFKDYTYFGDIADGLMWLKSNSELAIKKIIEGQKHVKKNYSNTAVSGLWEQAINNVLSK